MFLANGQVVPAKLHPIIAAVGKQLTVEATGPYGAPHWLRVDMFGQTIYRNMPSRYDGPVGRVTLFAVYHDCCRKSKKPEPYHGCHAANLFDQHIRDGLVVLSDSDAAQLRRAIKFHTRLDVGKDVDRTPLETLLYDANTLDSFRFGLDVDKVAKKIIEPNALPWDMYQLAAALSGYRGFVVREAWALVETIKKAKAGAVMTDPNGNELHGNDGPAAV